MSHRQQLPSNVDELLIGAYLTSDTPRASAVPWESHRDNTNPTFVSLDHDGYVSKRANIKERKVGQVSWLEDSRKSLTPPSAGNRQWNIAQKPKPVWLGDTQNIFNQAVLTKQYIHSTVDEEWLTARQSLTSPNSPPTDNYGLNRTPTPMPPWRDEAKPTKTATQYEHSVKSMGRDEDSHDTTPNKTFISNDDMEWMTEALSDTALNIEENANTYMKAFQSKMLQNTNGLKEIGQVNDEKSQITQVRDSSELGHKEVEQVTEKKRVVPIQIHVQPFVQNPILKDTIQNEMEHISKRKVQSVFQEKSKKVSFSNKIVATDHSPRKQMQKSHINNSKSLGLTNLRLNRHNPGPVQFIQVNPRPNSRATLLMYSKTDEILPEDIGMGDVKLTEEDLNQGRLIQSKPNPNSRAAIQMECDIEKFQTKLELIDIETNEEDTLEQYGSETKSFRSMETLLVTKQKRKEKQYSECKTDAWGVIETGHKSKANEYKTNAWDDMDIEENCKATEVLTSEPKFKPRKLKQENEITKQNNVEQINTANGSNEGAQFQLDRKNEKVKGKEAKERHQKPNVKNTNQYNLHETKSTETSTNEEETSNENAKAETPRQTENKAKVKKLKHYKHDTCVKEEYQTAHEATNTKLTPQTESQIKGQTDRAMFNTESENHIEDLPQSEDVSKQTLVENGVNPNKTKKMEQVFAVKEIKPKKIKKKEKSVAVKEVKPKKTKKKVVGTVEINAKHEDNFSAGEIEDTAPSCEDITDDEDPAPCCSCAFLKIFRNLFKRK